MNAILRRDVLIASTAALGAMTLPLAAPAMAVPATAPDAADAVISLYHEACALRAYANAPSTSARDSEAAVDQISELEREATASPPTTLAGAIACVEWAMKDHIDFGTSGSLCWGDEFLHRLLSNALAALRQGSLAHA